MKKNQYLLNICAAALAVAGALGLVQRTEAQNSYALSSIWTVANNAAGTHIATGDVNRGMAYSAVSNTVFVVNKGVTGSGTTPAIDVFGGTNGVYLGSASVTGVSGGTFWLDQAGAGTDGVLYAGNLSTATASTAFTLYEWSNYNNAPAVGYTGNPFGSVVFPGMRVGDTMAATGAGTNTILAFGVGNGSTPTTNVILFSTADAVHFAPTVLSIAGLAAPGSGGGPNFGISFYTNNTLLFKPTGSSAYIVQFPTNFASLTSPVREPLLGRWR